MKKVAGDMVYEIGVKTGCNWSSRGVQRGNTPPNECPGNDTKQSDGEAPVMLELWRMQCTPLLPLLPSPFWPGVVAPDWVK